MTSETGKHTNHSSTTLPRWIAIILALAIVILAMMLLFGSRGSQSMNDDAGSSGAHDLWVRTVTDLSIHLDFGEGSGRGCAKYGSLKIHLNTALEGKG